VYPASHGVFSKPLRLLSTNGFTHQYPYNARVTERNADVKVKMFGQENAVLPYVFVTDKMIFLCETATRPVQPFITPVTRPHKLNNKIPSLHTEAVGYPTWNYIVIGFSCMLQQHNKTLPEIIS